MISVVLFGYGNVGTHLYKALNKKANVQVEMVYSPSLEKKVYGETLFTNTLDAIPKASVWIVALPDIVIHSFVNQLPKTNALVVHTAGSVSIDELKQFEKRGVFYPLQTFSKHTKVKFKKIPICIEAENKADLKLLHSLASILSKNVIAISSEKRLKLHLGAVWVNNFSNHLFHLAEDFLKYEELDFNLLMPLINETTRKLNETSPKEAQTGPAKRFDLKTIETHLALLKNDTQKKLYQLFTESIQEKFKK